LHYRCHQSCVRSPPSRFGLSTYGGVTGSLDAAQLYTNEFVPEGKEFIPPQSV